jgi:hypothetical protein
MKDRLLENFMKEFFPFTVFRKAGIFTKEMKGDYKKQADKICYLFGYQSVYEYRSQEVRCHISYEGQRPLYVDDGGKLIEEPFITVIKSIYEE